jgi:hypothetical protein
VFAHPDTGRPLDRSKVRKRFKAAVKRAGVREVRYHDLRHSFGTAMAGAGVPMRTLKEWLGHRDFATTLIYSDYAPSEHEREWVEAAFTRGRLVPPEVTRADCRVPRPTTKATPEQGFRRNGASRTRTGDLLGAIQPRGEAIGHRGRGIAGVEPTLPVRPPRQRRSKLGQCSLLVPQREGTVRRIAFAGKQERAGLVAPLLLLVPSESERARGRVPQLL